jgi:hypothetical protein
LTIDSPLAKDGALSADQLIKAVDTNNPIHPLVETALMGPELELPNGYYFVEGVTTGEPKSAENGGTTGQNHGASWRCHCQTSNNSTTNNILIT